MATWSPEELDRIGATDELDIAPVGKDGSLRPYTTIWVVRVGDDLYVRSYRGRGGGWFSDVTFSEPDGTVRAAIDQTYRTKYARYGDTYVVPMVSPDAAAATFALTPR
jgi:hypothetical protein